ncbi:microviridin/marinostatin family tricyclic proteinase inhibitor [Chryseobacterium salviniae]|uniref:Microviridin/marinostatin family tricyclic proteinase inhibitor n=1 Tax=Chryseobacterium salviniae TaxID=3101750 RepID=A0ABU6HT94_9FLAO|nr:microviridin/marinostatin family tricyclic proteinase inhibitor [Chryseobacterium sp. T9W2-O]MEC3875906.1 microviridin/marinostatin family tricyclic proteinase inhibitor [Chryseobacterium sp. T9W2-O]
MEGKKNKKPFFASFLEKQIQDPETIKGGSGTATSVLADNSTGALTDSVTSVQLDTITKPGSDVVSMKYPSDSDEDGTLL